MPGSARPFLQLLDIRHAYGDTEVLRGLSLDVREGEFLTLLGPSGSGKSTTLNLVAGFEFPDAGSVRLAGTDVTRVPSNGRDVGMVFQSYALFPHMSVAENVAFPLQLRGVRGAELMRRVADTLRLVQMDAFGERFPQQLSGGQQQRVAIARAIVYGPRLLLMDEPLGALDRKLRGEMQFELKKLQAELGMTLLYVTHDQEEALAMSDRIAVLDRGVLVQCAPPDEIYARPATPFVAGFIGETNLFEGEIVRSSRQSLLDCSTARLQIPLPDRSDWTDGQRIVVSVRPEHVRVRAASGDAPSARIDGIQYLGDAVRCRMLRNGVEITAKLPFVATRELLRPGREVALEFDVEQVHAFDGA